MASLQENSLYRRTFVGRERELKQLQDAFDTAVAGNGALVMVIGEPGIGKTALCEQLASYVLDRGGTALTGHCYEEGSLSLPYLPFIEAIRAYAQLRDSERLRAELGAGTADVARMVPDIQERLQIELRPPSDPADDRWRLLQAVSDFLRSAAAARPLLLVLEDLHWADRGTLDLLQHVARNLQAEGSPGRRSHLLVVCTYRDVEVDRSHPLAAALADLSRAGSFQRVALHGLNVHEVHRMYESLRGNDVSLEQAELVQRQTEGNPLFVQEVLRYLVEEGIVVLRSGQYVRADDRTVQSLLPEGLRDVVGKRLSRLSDRTNHVLSLASVAGREFRLTVLLAVASLNEDKVIEALEEAIRVGVLEERATPGVIQYRFTHAFFRQTLYEEMSAARRLRYHQQIARTLEEQYAGHLDDHAAELADHFTNSTDDADLAKAITYGELAAQRAMSVFAYGEAVRLLERALDVLQVQAPDDRERRCDLLLTLGDALVARGEWQRALEQVAEEAYALADGLQDAHRASLACQIAQQRQANFGAADTLALADLLRRWAERAGRWAAAGTQDRVHADIFLANFARSILGSDSQARASALRALELARNLGDADSVAQAAPLLLGGSITPPEQHEERLRVARSIATIDFEAVSTSLLGPLLQNWAWVHLTWSDRDATEDLWTRLAMHAERSQYAQVAVLPLVVKAHRQMLDGQLLDIFDTATQIITKAAAVGRAASGVTNAGQVTRRPLIYLGRADEALAELPQLPSFFAVGGVYSAQLAMCLAHVGRLRESQDVLDQFKAKRDLGSADDETSAAVLRFLIEPAVLTGDIELSHVLLRRFAPLASLLVTEANQTYCIGRLIGDAAVLLGRAAEARGYYDQALEACEKVRFRPDIALTRLSLGQLLLQHYPDERSIAMEHLDFAITEFEAMGMQPSLQRALRLRSRRRRATAPDDPGYPDRLSEREVEVLRLVAAGKSNQQIADQLVISLNTAMHHVANIFNKTGAANRADAASYAHRHDLV